VLLLKLMSDAPQAIVAWPAVAFDVRITRDLVSVFHAVAEDTVALINYHPTLFARPHFLEVSMGPGGLLPHFELRQDFSDAERFLRRDSSRKIGRA